MKRLKLKVTFINVGNGDSILVQSYEEGRVFTMLIDGGSGEAQEYAGNTTGRIRTVDFLKHEGVDHLDVMVNTHIHEDHTCGLLPVARYLTPGQLWQPYSLELAKRMEPITGEVKGESRQKFVRGLNDYVELCNFVEKKGGFLCQTLAGSQEMQLCENLRVSVLGPSLPSVQQRMCCFQQIYGQKQRKEEKKLEQTLDWLDKNMNDSSVILCLRCENRRILLSGDTGADGYGSAENRLRCDVFKVGHHGQKNGLSRELLEKITPDYAVISASSDRRYESADPKLCSMLSELGTRLLFTDCVRKEKELEDARPHSGVRILIYAGGELETEYLPAFAGYEEK